MGCNVKRIAERIGEGLTTEAATDEVWKQYLAVLFLLGADRGRYGKLLEELENSYAQHLEMYTVTLVDVYPMIEKLTGACITAIINHHSHHTSAPKWPLPTSVTK